MRGKQLFAAVIAVSLALASCSDDDENADAAASRTSADETSTETDGAGSDAAASIKIGYVNNEGGALSLPEYRIGGEVAVDVINDGGGINGSDIELVTCIADGSPEGSINCANQLIDAHVSVAYTGIDLASDAALPLYESAGIPFVTTTGWGPAQKDNEYSFLLHTALSAYAAAPLATFDELGAARVAVLADESTPAGQSFITDVVDPVAERLDIEVVRVPFDLTNPDFTQAVTNAISSDPDGIMAQLDEGGCIGLVTATSTLGFEGPVMPGSCSGFIEALGPDSAGSYVFSPVFSVDTIDDAPDDIQENLDVFEQAMIQAGHEDLVESFANVPFSGVMELAAILETIEGDVTAESALEALRTSETSPGFLGSDLSCGAPPVASEPSACRGDFLAFEVVIDDDGEPRKALVGGGFQDVSDLLD